MGIVERIEGCSGIGIADMDMERDMPAGNTAEQPGDCSHCRDSMGKILLVYSLLCRTGEGADKAVAVEVVGAVVEGSLG